MVRVGDPDELSQKASGSVSWKFIIWIFLSGTIIGFGPGYYLGDSKAESEEQSKLEEKVDNNNRVLHQRITENKEFFEGTLQNIDGRLDRKTEHLKQDVEYLMEIQQLKTDNTDLRLRLDICQGKITPIIP